MLKFLKNHYPLVCALLVLWICVLFLLMFSLKKTGGVFLYLLDDPYIHLAIAKNLVLNHNFGVIPGSFHFASSSPLWTLLLSSGFFIFGVTEYLPFILTIFFSSLLVTIVYFIIKKELIASSLNLFLLLSVIVFGPCIALVFTGLEHIFHSLLTVVVIYLSSRYIVLKNKNTGLWLLFLAPILTATRYEGIFLVIVVCLFLFLRKEYIFAVSLLLLSLLPALIGGFISLSHGWWFLPSSIMIKGNFPNTTSLFYFLYSTLYHLFRQLAETPELCVLLSVSLILLILLIKEKGFWARETVMLMLFSLTTLAHLQFASVGWFYRYEAYLVISGILVNGLTGYGYLRKITDKYFIKQAGTNKLLIIAATVIILSPLIHRGFESFSRVPSATKNIYDQQYQIACFLNENYKEKRIAVNDIGLISYYCDQKTVDLWGITNLDAANLKRSGNFNRTTITEILKINDVNISILFRRWFEGMNYLPSDWATAGTWRIENNLVCSDEEVAFSADSTQYEQLILNLKKYSKKLPSDIIQKGIYLNSLK